MRSVSRNTSAKTLRPNGDPHVSRGVKTTTLPETEQVREYVRQRYGAIAEQSDATCGCVATGCCGGGGQTYGEKLGYSAGEIAAAPAGADLGLGCGNPLAIASIK